MNKKNVLFIEPFLPYPLVSGGHQAVYNGIAAVVDEVNAIVTYKCGSVDEENIKGFVDSLNGKVRVMPYCEPQVAKEEKIPLIQRVYHNSKEWIKHKLIKQEEKPKIPVLNYEYKSWINEFMPIPVEYEDFVNRIVADYNVDIVQCEMVRNAPFVLSLPKYVKKIFVHHELRYVTKEQCLGITSGNEIDKKAYLELTKLLEIGMLNRFDEVVTLSDVDKDKLLSEGVKVPIEVSYPTVKTNIRGVNNCMDFANKLCFIGTYNHYPNENGLFWFLDNCWEEINANNEYVLNIIGTWSAELIAEITQKYKRVRFLGFVDDLSEAMKDSIMIVPILIGSGIRMKIIEAVSCGVPVVTTSIGVEGIPFCSNEHCVIADNAKDFVNAIISMNDYVFREKLTRKAFDVVQKMFSFENMKKSRIKIYKYLY